MLATPCSIHSHSFCNFHGNRTFCTSHGSVVIHRQHALPAVLSAKNGLFSAEHGLLALKITHKKQKTCRGINVVNEIHEVASSSGSNVPEWLNWIWVGLLGLLIPILRTNVGPLQLLKKKVDKAIDVAEMVTEVVEEVAEKVEEVADDIADKLPDDVKLKEALRTVEVLAQKAVEDAKKAEAVIHQVEEAEKELEELVKSSKEEESVPNQKSV